MKRRRLFTLCLGIAVAGSLGAAIGAAVAQTTADPPSLFPPALRVKGCTQSSDGAKVPVDSIKVIALFNACAIGGAPVASDCSCTCWDGSKVTLASLSPKPGAAAVAGTVAACPPLGLREMQDSFDAFLAIEPTFQNSLKNAETLFVNRPKTPDPASSPSSSQ